VREQLLDGFGITFDELSEGQLVSFDQPVYVVYGGYL
jgi:hypothetical protein